MVGISGGHEISIEQAPFMASIHRYYGLKLISVSGGSIIQENFILTAAHCVEKNKTKKYRIGVGTADAYETNQLYDIKEIRNYFDLSLIKLERNLTFGPAVGIAKPANIEVSPGAMLNVTGWGSTKESFYYASKLHQVEVPLLSDKECKTVLSNLSMLKYNSQTICAGKRGFGICQGDLGSPLTLGNLLVGVAVGGFDLPCGSQEAGIYTRVTSAITWILETIRCNYDY